VKFTRMANVESLRIMVLDFGLFRERDYYLVKMLLSLLWSERVCLPCLLLCTSEPQQRDNVILTCHEGSFSFLTFECRAGGHNLLSL
jgi:hypothetical protein